ncbi:MAG TPA: chromosomal replication initiator protein DnaA [Acidimicrobiia bacterium]
MAAVGAAGGWTLFRERVKARVSPVIWQNWLDPLEAGDQTSDQLQLVAPTEFHARWVNEKHLDVLSETAGNVYGPGTAVVLSARSPAAEPIPIPSQPSGAEEHHPAPATRQSPNGDHGLNGKYTFDNFVVGQSNRFAHAAAMAVAEQPATHYNPLFIYGGAGLGKTHLLHAVGHHCFELHPTDTVRYISSENFFNDFIDGIRRKRMDSFKARYRTTDVLLLDDVQFFEGKEQILEEFFHTFNDLYESGKQMVLTADRPPKHLSSLEDRLRSRFEWGLLTDIQPPDVETRLAILRKNAERQSQPVSEEVLRFIAVHIKDNIRELEGALTRVTAFAALTKQPTSLEMAQDVLQDLAPHGGPRAITTEEIIAEAGAEFGFQTIDLLGPSRRQPLVLSRQIAMYLCREHTDLSLPKIGALFGGRDHTTVLHAIDKVRRLMRTDRATFERVNALSRRLGRT